MSNLIQPPTLALHAPDGRSWPVPNPGDISHDLTDGAVYLDQIDGVQRAEVVQGAWLRWTYTDTRYDPNYPLGEYDRFHGEATINADGSVALQLPRCDECDGAGTLEVPDHAHPVSRRGELFPCPVCEGTGRAG